MLFNEAMRRMIAAQVRLTARGRDTYAAKSGEHDDLVIAVALAVCFAKRAGLGRGLIRTVRR